jgi:hypothetical protein
MGKILALLVMASATAGASDLYPMAVGYQWTYIVRSTYPGCPEGDRAAVVLGEEEVSGRRAFKVQGACVGYSPGYLSVQGDLVDAEYAGGWWRVLEPASEGHAWEEFRTTAVWNSIGAVTVAAGTFPGCWRKTRRVAYTDWADYCPAVGLVRARIVDLAGGYIDFELKSFRFPR